MCPLFDERSFSPDEQNHTKRLYGLGRDVTMHSGIGRTCRLG